MRKMSTSGVEGDMSLERAIAQKVHRFLDTTKTAEILGTVGLFMTQSLAESAHDVSERGVGHRWLREKSFVRSRNCRGEIIVFNALFFEFEILKGMDWRWYGKVGRGRRVGGHGAIFFLLEVWNWRRRFT